MGVIEINWKPDRRQLRQFAAISLAGFGVLGAMAAWRLGGWTAPAALWIVGVLIGVAGLALPKSVYPVYVLLTAVTLPIGWVTSHAMLALIYYGLLTPIGLVFRVIGRDAMTRRFDPEAKSYWVARRPPAAAVRYFRQF